MKHSTFNIKLMKKVFIKSLPIMCSYIFIGTAYGMMMQNAGYKWYYSLLASLTIYTGAFQFVLITLLSSGASLLTIGLTAFLMNSRQSFYALTFIDEFNKMGSKKVYMINTMTDETYAVNCSLNETGEEKQKLMFGVAILSKFYWAAGSVIGGILGQLIPFDLEGIDFCMTALFVIIFVEQWEKSKSHIPALTGIAASLICLFVVGERYFLLPSLIISSAILIVWNSKRSNV